MSAPTLERRIARWFAASLFLLYGVVAAAIWATSRADARQVAVLTLETEAEVVAGYVAATGRLDAPELAEAELEPFPIWIRIYAGMRVIAVTPGAPELPWAGPASTEEVLYLRAPGQSKPHLVVRHAVGGSGTESGRATAVEAIGDISSLRDLERRLVSGLLLLGLVIIPVSSWGGRLLARRALAPLASLVGQIRALEPERAENRLAVPPRTVDEVNVLAATFNAVLGRLEQSLGRMGRFTADASHEIRNPLSVMRTGLEVALRRERTPEEYRLLLAENLEEIDQLQATLDGLLSLARTEPGSSPEIAREPVDFGALVRRTAARFSAAAAERRATITLDVAEGLVASGDERLLRLIPFNLIDNALKHGPAGGTIAVAAARQGDRIVLRVADDGAGIPATERARVFERYARLGPDGGDSGLGGLGLSVVRWVAEAHAGSVAIVDSERGARFEVVLPAG